MNSEYRFVLSRFQTPTYKSISGFSNYHRILINTMYGVNAGAIGEPERILEIPDPIPNSAPIVPSGTPDGVPDYVPDYVPDSFPTPAPAENQSN